MDTYIPDEGCWEVFGFGGYQGWVTPDGRVISADRWEHLTYPEKFRVVDRERLRFEPMLTRQQIIDQSCLGYVDREWKVFFHERHHDRVRTFQIGYVQADGHVYARSHDSRPTFSYIGSVTSEGRFKSYDHKVEGWSMKAPDGETHHTNLELGGAALILLVVGQQNLK